MPTYTRDVIVIRGLEKLKSLQVRTAYLDKTVFFVAVACLF